MIVGTLEVKQEPTMMEEDSLQYLRLSDYSINLVSDQRELSDLLLGAANSQEVKEMEQLNIYRGI